jgi:hypothetical protein
MPSIEVDFDVFKALTARRPSEEVSENDVLRQLLHLPRKSPASELSELPGPDDWVVKGVRIPVGTELRAAYKGKIHLGRVAEGALVLNGSKFESPSAAAMSITHHPVNGWIFWQCRRPGQGKWTQLRDLRRKSSDTVQ